MTAKEITSAIKDAATDVNGGLLLSSIIAVRDVTNSKTEVSEMVLLDEEGVPPYVWDYAHREVAYQLGDSAITPPNGGIWSAKPLIPTSTKPIVWGKFRITYNAYEAEATTPVAYYYADNPLVSITPEWQIGSTPFKWEKVDSNLGGYPKARAIATYTNPLKGKVRGYMSALGGSMPFIAAGVKNFGGERGVPEERVVEVWQDGRFKFAGLRYNPDNEELEFADEVGKPYMTLGGTPLSVRNLNSSAGEVVRTLDYYFEDRAGNHQLPIASVKLDKDGGELSFTATLTAHASIKEGSMRGEAGDVRDDYFNSSITCHAGASVMVRHTSSSGRTRDFRVGDVVYATTTVPLIVYHSGNPYGGNYSVELLWSGGSSSVRGDVRERLTQLQKGTYDFYLVYDYSMDDNIAQGGGSAAISDMNAKVYTTPNVQYIRYTDRGLMAYYGVRKHFVVDKYDADALVTIKGKTDIPGVLASGRCDMYGGINYQWGRYANAQGWNTARVEKLSYGKYKVHHTIGHTRYTPQVTVENVGSLVSASFTDIRETYFVACIYGTNGLRDASFSYVCLGDNE